MRNVTMLFVLATIGCYEAPVPVTITNETPDNPQVTPVMPNEKASGCYVSDRITQSEFRGRICNARYETRDIPVLLVPSAPHLRSDIDWAIKYINSHAGVKIFTLDPDESGAKIEIYEDEFQNNNNLGLASWSYDEFRLNYGSVAVWKGFGEDSSHDRALVLAHELLHTLGYSHDLDGCSIMKPVFDDQCPEIRSDDVRAMRLLYGSTGELYPTFYAGIDVSGHGLSSASPLNGHAICPN
jgi:hypothetical protein